MKKNILKTVILSAGVIGLHYYGLVEEQTTRVLIVFILGYFFGMKDEETRRMFKKSTRPKKTAEIEYKYNPLKDSRR